MDPIEEKGTVVLKVERAVAGRHPLVRWVLGCVYWLFPLVLLGIGYLIGYFVPAFRTSVLSKWPVEASVWPPLLLILILALTWQLFDLFWVFSRETTSRNLQLNNTISVFIAIVLSVAFGYLINTKDGTPWWFIIPFLTAVVDAFTTGWAAINNATQKPFMTEKGRA